MCNQEVICVAVYQIKQCVAEMAGRIAIGHWCVFRASEFDRLATCHCDYSPDAMTRHPTQCFSEVAFQQGREIPLRKVLEVHFDHFLELLRKWLRDASGGSF